MSDALSTLTEVMSCPLGTQEKAMAKGYWITFYRSISDPAVLAAYAKLAGPAVISNGGRFLARGGTVKTYEQGITQRTVRSSSTALSGPLQPTITPPIKRHSPCSARRVNATCVSSKAWTEFPMFRQVAEVLLIIWLKSQGGKSMWNTAMIALCAGFVTLVASPLSASAQDAIAAPAQKTIGQSGKSAMIPSLAVINSRGASLEGNTLTMIGVSSNSVVFADRPFRAAGHVLTKHFLKEWDEGSDSFAKDPPNATISVLSAEGDSVEDAVVVLKSPKLEGDKLTFEVSVLEGSLSKATGPASLFIDWFAARGYGGRAFVGGVGYHGGAAWHGAWYGHPAGYGVGAAAVGLGAAAVGAAAAGAYYHPYGYPYYAPPPAACGYYPYPPCY
jgi:hypothetical protein